MFVTARSSTVLMSMEYRPHVCMIKTHVRRTKLPARASQSAMRPLSASRKPEAGEISQARERECERGCVPQRVRGRAGQRVQVHQEATLAPPKKHQIRGIFLSITRKNNNRTRPPRGPFHFTGLPTLTKPMHNAKALAGGIKHSPTKKSPPPLTK